MRLVACAQCHTQFDVSGLAQNALRCHCGMLILVGAQQGRMVAIARCGECGAPWAEGASRCEYCGGNLDTSQDLPLICPECYARNPEASRHCRGCGVAFRPEPLRRESSDALCPRCNANGQPTLMDRRELCGLWLSECLQCHGLWVARSDFEELLKRTSESPLPVAEESGGPAPIDPQAHVHYVRCPACDELMQRRNFEVISGVIIDRCANHGVWLDSDELERIARFIAEGGVTRARAYKLQELGRNVALESDGRFREKLTEARSELRTNWLASILERSKPF